MSIIYFITFILAFIGVCVFERTSSKCKKEEFFELYDKCFQACCHPDPTTVNEDKLRDLKNGIASGFDVQFDHDMLLRMAALCGNVKAVDMLLKAGANPNSKAKTEPFKSIIEEVRDDNRIDNWNAKEIYEMMAPYSRKLKIKDLS